MVGKKGTKKKEDVSSSSKANDASIEKPKKEVASSTKVSATDKSPKPTKVGASSKKKAQEAGTPKKKTKALRFLTMSAGSKQIIKEDKTKTGTLYIGHLPDGFYEPQMKKFFSQFGRVTRLRCSRSIKNAKSKGYGFIEFADVEVAKIVAQTMHKYLLFGKNLVCHLMDKDKVHKRLWDCSKNFRNFQPKRLDLAKKDLKDRPTVMVNGEMVPQTTTTQAKKRKDAGKKAMHALKELGISYDFEEDDKPEEEEKPKAAKRKAESASEPAKKKKKQT